LKIVRIETLINEGEFSHSDIWAGLRASLHEAIRAVDWPPGSGSFKIYPERGKKRGKGNGVTPIKKGLMARLKREQWRLEVSIDIATVKRPGKFDAVFNSGDGPIVIEWETGNISSSHRSLNKMALALHKGIIAAGTLVVPSRDLCPYLTDRVGNINELEPYFDLGKCIPCRSGVLEIVVIEHDEISEDVPRIRKGTSGRARK
jgi:hypothetical protein